MVSYLQSIQATVSINFINNIFSFHFTFFLHKTINWNTHSNGLFDYYLFLFNSFYYLCCWYILFSCFFYVVFISCILFLVSKWLRYGGLCLLYSSALILVLLSNGSFEWINAGNVQRMLIKYTYITNII